MDSENLNQPSATILGQMRPGEGGTVQSVGGLSHHDTLLEERLREIGFEEGLSVTVVHQAPLGRDPIAVRIDQTLVALRRCEADLVCVDMTASKSKIHA